MLLLARVFKRQPPAGLGSLGERARVHRVVASWWAAAVVEVAGPFPSVASPALTGTAPISGSKVRALALGGRPAV